MSKKVELIAYKVLAAASTAGAALVASGTLPAYFSPVFTACAALSMFFHSQVD
jgi:hypothetical protein